MTPDMEQSLPATDIVQCDTPEETVALLKTLYSEAVELIAERFKTYGDGAEPEKNSTRAHYPYLCVEIGSEFSTRTNKLVMGRLASSSFHASTITSPDLFEDYLLVQLHGLKRSYNASFYVGRSTVPIPLTFAVERASANLTVEQRRDLQNHFYLPNLVSTNDDIVDGGSILKQTAPFPLCLFSAERVDYSLHRLTHYTATHPQHFQRYVLFTNYQRYVDEFIEFGKAAVKDGSYETLVEPGNRITTKNGEPDEPPLKKMPQMPAYHLTRDQHTGITLINIGVGPSNAKTITDHVAVLRPDVWVMVGHCGGLRRTQRLGDYVLAHAYWRDDHVLDRVLPPTIPLPTIAEVQQCLTAAVQEITGLSGADLKEHLRTGTVVTSDDRNWELRFEALAVSFNQSRAIAVDMESATIAANGYRFRVPYGTLLCVSDKPLHGELKLPGMADAFYTASVSQHLKIGIKAMEMMREEARRGTLHSRKLRSFDEPVFR